MGFHVLKHALADTYLVEARDKGTSVPRFRELVQRLGGLIASEAIREWPTVPVTVETPCGTATGGQLRDPIVIVPILRAGLAYADGVSQVLPMAHFGHIGLFRDENTHLPVPYFCKVPRNLDKKRILLTDPMLATGHSAVTAVDELIAKGAIPSQITLLTMVASPEGRDVFLAAHPDVEVWTVALDDCLNEKAYIVPGLGDAGDRIFGTLD